MSSTFEPKTIIAILKNSSCVPAPEKKDFELDWKKAVSNLRICNRLGHIDVHLPHVDIRRDGWLKHRGLGTKDNQTLQAQLEWEAHVVEYVFRIYKETRCHGNTKNAVPRSLPRDVPLFGPRFIPPTYLHERKRKSNPRIEPKIAYLKPLNIIHPLYYDNIGRCPKCTSTDILWSCWTPSGHRILHGMREEETALGYQLICKQCQNRFSRAKGKEGCEEGMYCFATTNAIFWEKWEHWEIPRSIPYFLRRCAITRNLFDLVVEMRPSSTSMGLAEHIRQLHLLTYKQKMLEYLQNLEYRTVSPFRTDPLTAFSHPFATDGYCDNSITDDLITHIFNEFSERTRKKESEQHLQTLSAKCLSLDNTFRCAGKATVVDKDKTRTKLMKGGILNVLNENGEIVGWRFCLSASPDEITEFLQGYMHRCEMLGVAPPEMVVVDNCCQMRNAIQKAIPAVRVVLDVYHFHRRYGAVVINGVKNPSWSEVALDIVQAIIKTKAVKGTPATYWDQEEQVRRLEHAFEKWAKKGNVWSAAATKVHAEQMRHAQKGCLMRTRHDIAADGSRTEASHKGWNSIQRSFASGIEMFIALAHDFVLRRNIRVASAHNNTPAFIESTHGSHHVSLTHRIAVLWNQILEKEKKPSSDLLKLPEMLQIDSRESFGLGTSKHVETFGGFMKVDEECLDPERRVNTPFEELDAEINDYLQNLDIDPVHHTVPLQAFSDMTAAQQPAVGCAENGRKDATSQHEKDTDQTIRSKLTTSDNARRLRASASDQAAINVAEDSATHDGTTSVAGIKRKANPIERLDTPVVKKPYAGGSISVTSQTRVRDFFRLGANTQQSQQHVFDKSPLKAVQALSLSTSWVQQLSKRLELPDSRALTRSQHLFSIATNIDARSLSIRGDNEFFLFMEMRIENQWASFNMTSKKWVAATHQYNTRLDVLNIEKGSTGTTIQKNPRALLEKLGEVENRIVTRVLNGNYTSSRSKTDTFWKLHCHAVPLIKSEYVNDSEAVKTRKPATCGRCHTIMYPGPSGSSENHKRGYCSDGVKQAKGTPAWPQPHGIFATGKTFDPVNFLHTLRKVYENVVVQGDDGGDFAMEYDVFLQMLKDRTVATADGRYLFKLFDDLTIPPTFPGELIVELEGSKLLRMDCLCDNEGSC